MPPCACWPGQLMARLELRRQAREADERGVEHADAGAALECNQQLLDGVLAFSRVVGYAKGRQRPVRAGQPALAGNGSVLGAHDLVRPACPFASRVRACQPFLKVCLNHCGQDSGALRLPASWPWPNAWQRLFTAATDPPAAA